MSISPAGPFTAQTSVTSGSPRVRVPVLSNSTVSALRAFSSSAPPRNSTPSSAARPEPTIMPVGVARPSAQGQAITSTSQQATMAFSRSPGLAAKYHTPNTAAAISTTAGTKREAILSASRWIGALEVCARRTISIICCRTESLPSLAADMRALPERFSVPPNTVSPAALSTGRLSPVSMDSSTAQLPPMIIPSTGTLSPGRRTTTSCSHISSMSSSFSSPSRSTSAVFGWRRMRRRMAPEVSVFARFSRYFPNRMRHSSTHSERKYNCMSISTVKVTYTL